MTSLKQRTKEKIAEIVSFWLEVEPTVDEFKSFLSKALEDFAKETRLEGIKEGYEHALKKQGETVKVDFISQAYQEGAKSMKERAADRAQRVRLGSLDHEDRKQQKIVLEIKALPLVEGEK